MNMHNSTTINFSLEILIIYNFYRLENKLSCEQARSRKSPSAVTYGNSKRRISRLVLVLGTQSIEQKKMFSNIELISVMNLLGSVQPDHDVHWRLIPQMWKKIRPWNFNTALKLALKLSFQLLIDIFNISFE